MRTIIVGVLLWTLFAQPALGNGLCTRPKALIGSKARSEAQVVRAKESGSAFFANETVIQLLAGSGALVEIQEGTGYKLDGIGTSRTGCSNYPANIREALFYVRLEVAEFLTFLGSEFANVFQGRAFEVTALARTKWWQDVLHQCELSAVRLSPHQWGLAFDISKRDLTPEEVCWLWATLLPLQEQGFVTVVDEGIANNIHISVYTEFLVWRAAERDRVFRFIISALF